MARPNTKRTDMFLRPRRRTLQCAGGRIFSSRLGPPQLYRPIAACHTLSGFDLKLTGGIPRGGGRPVQACRSAVPEWKGPVKNPIRDPPVDTWRIGANCAAHPRSEWNKSELESLRH